MFNLIRQLSDAYEFGWEKIIIQVMHVIHCQKLKIFQYVVALEVAKKDDFAKRKKIPRNLAQFSFQWHEIPQVVPQLTLINLQYCS